MPLKNIFTCGYNKLQSYYPSNISLNQWVNLVLNLQYSVHFAYTYTSRYYIGIYDAEVIRVRQSLLLFTTLNFAHKPPTGIPSFYSRYKPPTISKFLNSSWNHFDSVMYSVIFLVVSYLNTFNSCLYILEIYIIITVYT